MKQLSTAQQEANAARADTVVTKELRARALHAVGRMPATTVGERERKLQARQFVLHKHRKRSDLEAFCERMEKNGE